MDRSRRPGDRSGRQWPQALLASSDEQLVELVLAGDDLAFELLFERHVADALWFAREVLGSWSEAEEAVRHSFAAARAYLAARDRGVEFRPWLQTILGNHCLSIVQARGPRPSEVAQVVDLDAWRSRRRRLGVAAPLAPLAGLREGMLALCGIGSGAAATGGATAGGASLVSGTLAKVAVAALLAGSVGVAGSAVSEREERSRPALADSARDPSPTRAIAALGATGTDVLERLRERAAADSPREPAERRDRPVSPLPAPVTTPSVPPPPAETVAVTPPVPSPSAAPVPAAAVPPAAHGGGAAAIGEPVRSALPVVDELVGEDIPAVLETLTPPSVPLPAELGKIGDDLPVTADTLTAEARALLSQGTPPATP